MTPRTESAERRRITIRRRRIALGAVALLAAAAGGIVGDRTGDDEDGASAMRERPECPHRLAGDPRRLAGQMLIARMEASATAELSRAAGRGEIGGVIAFPPVGTSAGTLERTIRDLQRAALRGGNPPLLVAIDQEGGDVKRLPGPPERSPGELAASGDERQARAEGEATGRYLRELGINVDLAPVLDLGSPGSFVASRTFGDDPDRVGALGVAFADGLGAAGVGATAKHFPGLGLASANTDLGPSTVDATRAELDPGLEPFRAAVDAGVPLVMMSNATYPTYGQPVPAAFEPRIVTGLLRRRLGFDGAVITDDLFAGAVSGSGYDPGGAAVAAASAGADLLLYARSPAPQALPALVEALRRGRLTTDRLRDSCARILALKDVLATPAPDPGG